MTDTDLALLDNLFEWLGRAVPKGYKADIVEGCICMSRWRSGQRAITVGLRKQLQVKHSMRRRPRHMRIDFPGSMNGFAPDVAVLRKGARRSKGRWRYQDVEFVAEVVCKATEYRVFGPKKHAYATAGVPVYLIADPRNGECHVFTRPEDGAYRRRLTAAFGVPIDLTDTVVGLTLTTNEFPRD
ncbi:Uma2 family endonuclease [Streptantibioticus rubrisoli]|uniref:Uma2 family endonuclease n=1 Tax=Streptantibioticus rubrisoli TaxID=1387313 RepID=A0ABT1PJM6_9ACTN|nr:Uma2 family endonuclease [Streptantibioticus rubrisoli]MCQ4045562.1 Uma2 family endonuclease [Streptantibioticus rubrisoli]